MPKFTNHKKRVVAAQIASGVPLERVGDSVGISRTTIYRHLRGEGGKGELRKFIEEQTQKLIDAVPEAVDLIRNTIDDSAKCEVTKVGEPDPKNRDLNIRLRKIAIDSANDVLKTASIAPTQSQSVHVQALIVGGRDCLSPVVARLLGIPDKEEDIVDVTPVEDPIFQTVEEPVSP